MADPVSPLDIPRIAPPPDVAAPPADAVKSNDVFSKVLTAGTGQARPSPADAVTVHYTAWTTDGSTFDDSRSRGTPTTWRIAEAMPGVAQGLQEMVVGEKRRMWIPPALTHEWARRPLVFDIELLAIAPVPPTPSADEFKAPPPDAVRTANGLAYKVLRPGSGADRPNAMSTVTIHYIAWTAGQVAKFDDSVARDAPLTVAVDTLMPGLSDALQRMAVGERTRVWIPEALAYTPPGPPRAALIVDVELLGIQKAVEGPPGTIRVQCNTADVAYVLVQPDGTPRTAKGPQTLTNAVPGQYRVKAPPIRLYAVGVVAKPADLMLAAGGTLEITITYRPIVR